MQFKVGVIGATGYIGTPYRREIRESDDAAIVALCARRLDLLTAAGAEDGAELLTDDWRQVVAHPDVNLVIVATPDALHYEAVMACAAAGKHVVCEKPVGLNATEAREMWQAIRDARLAHFVPFWTRFVPVFHRAREIYRAGTLGEIKAVVYRWHNPRPPDTPFTWRDNADLSSAGSIADVGSHAYDTMRWILGQDAIRVLAHADAITPTKADMGEINLDEALRWEPAHAEATKQRQVTAFDYAAIAFELQNGAVGSLLLSHAPILRKGFAPELELHGETASLAVDRLAGVLSIAHPGKPPEVLEKFAGHGLGNRFAKYVFPALRAQLDGHPIGYPDLQDGYYVQLFTDSAARSAQTGQWVQISAE